MKKIIFICDRCNSEIDRERRIEINGVHDLCESCAKQILADYFKKEDEPVKKEEKKKSVKQEHVKEARKAVKEKPVKQEGKVFDAPGAQAMRDAGWSCERIAEYMKCDPDEVYENTHKPEQKPPKEWEFTEDELRRMG